MATSSGNSNSPSSSLQQLQNSGSEEDLKLLMDQRKRKRMISNRESARRSRMRKQKHLDELSSQVAQLRSENQQVAASVNHTTQQFLTIESENSVLKAQVDELSHRLESLNEIIGVLNSNSGSNNGFGSDDHLHHHHHHHHGSFSSAAAEYSAAESFMNPWNMMCVNQPIMASPDMFTY